MNNKNEKMKATELTEQTKNQNVELTDDELDNVAGGAGTNLKRAYLVAAGDICGCSGATIRKGGKETDL